MDKANVLVIGNSGVGKSTLINAVLGEEVAKTGWGIRGTTPKLEIYESDDVPFRVIDSIGFEPGFAKEQRAVNAVQKWSRECAKKENENHRIDVIWFCVEGTSSKLFPKSIKNLIKATTMWKSIPVIVVITKSYSVPERDRNVKMVQEAFSSQKKYAARLKAIIPVVAQAYVINEGAMAPPEGIEELITATNDLIPEGMKAAEKDLANFIFIRKRALSHSIVTGATAVGVTVGAINKSGDAKLLAPVELAELRAIASVYGIKKSEHSKKLLDSMVEVGTVSTAAKAMINALQMIPGVNIASNILDAVIAGVVVAALGEGAIYVFEQIYLGNKSVNDIDWVKKIIETKLTFKMVEKIRPILEKLKDTSDPKSIMKAVFGIIDVLIAKK